MADELMDDMQREPEEQINELDETELDEVSGGRRVGAGCKVCRDCGGEVLEVLRQAPAVRKPSCHDRQLPISVRSRDSF